LHENANEIRRGCEDIVWKINGIYFRRIDFYLQKIQLCLREQGIVKGRSPLTMSKDTIMIAEQRCRFQ